jgi:hypothetical protein
MRATLSAFLPSGLFTISKKRDLRSIAVIIFCSTWILIPIKNKRAGLKAAQDFWCKIRVVIG